MKKLLLLSFACLLSATSVLGQDFWSPSETTGFGDSYNARITSIRAFKGMLYAGTGTDNAQIYRSSTGNLGSWNNVFNEVDFQYISDMRVTNEGGGYLFQSAHGFSTMTPKIMRSFDGSSWTNYFESVNPLPYVVPFKGTGAEDSIYVFENDMFGGKIKRNAYNAYDPLDTAATWQTVYDMSTIAPYSYPTCVEVMFGKMYIAINNGAQLYSTTDGTNFVRNDSVAYGFNNPNNYEISAIQSFGAFLYVGTYNYIDGPQIWRTFDELTWTLQTTFAGYERITDFEVAGGEMYVNLFGGSSGSGSVMKTSDGVSYTSSNSDGFEQPDWNHGEFGNMTVFGNNLYIGFKNYYSGGAIAPGPGGSLASPSSRGGGISMGGQIWRNCLLPDPTLDLGPDSLVCDGTPITFDAGPGFSSYHWNNEDTTQTTVESVSAIITCMVVDANGCSTTDTVNLNTIPAPSVSTNSGSVTACLGDSVNILNMATSNIRIPQPPIHKVTNTPISYTLGNTYDTIAVTGITECACTSLYSVTIDSLYHAYNIDVAISLYSPSGSFINLSLNANGSDYINTTFSPLASYTTAIGSGPFTDSFLPVDPFSNLTGTTTGNWILQTNDNYSSDDGVLKGWTIRFSVADSILTFSWSPTLGLSSSTVLNPNAAPPASTAYTLTTTSSNGCTETTPISITIPAIALTVADDSICFGSSTSITGTGGSTYFWNTTPSLSSSTGATVIASPAADEVFWVHDTASGCYFTDTVTIYVDDTIVVDGGLPPTICYSDTALLSATAISGTPPFSYIWSGPSGSSPTQSVSLSPDSTELWGVTMMDGFGCNSSAFSVYVNVMPSTDIHGHVTYSGGDVTDGTAVAYEFKPYLIHFDTIQISPLDGSGYYHFSAIDHADYIVKVFPNTATYPTLIPTYYGNTFLWDSAIVFSHACFVNDTLDIAVEEELIIPTGPGLLGGRIVEGVGFERLEGDPIPGIDVKLGRNPGGALITSTQTNTNGDYVFPNLPLSGPGESYVVYADIPGIGRDSSYNVVLDVTNPVYDSLNYLVDSSTVYILETSGTGVADATSLNNALSVYPNPTNGMVNIKYALSRNSRMSLGIYNVLGVRIAELVNTEQQPGNYKYTFNSRNYNLGAGVYFISLITDGKVSTHRLVITE